jgi:hypothetical protein
MTAIRRLSLILAALDAAARPAPLQCVAAAAGDPLAVTAPSNYGYVLVSPA